MRAAAMLTRSMVPGVVLLASACAHLPADEPADPAEPFNRAMFTFNRTADRYLLRPVRATSGTTLT
jgi:phospholipid-binding lipoprotein MlaA